QAGRRRGSGSASFSFTAAGSPRGPRQRSSARPARSSSTRSFGLHSLEARTSSATATSTRPWRTRASRAASESNGCSRSTSPSREASCRTARSSSSSRETSRRCVAEPHPTASSAREMNSPPTSTAPTARSPRSSPSVSSCSTEPRRPMRSQRKSMDTFETFPEQEEAKGLLRAALAEGPAHAYLFHGPRGVGKRRAALAFAGALLGDPDRVSRRAHPDLYVLEPLGDQIRIDPVRDLRRDLHMRPFEAARRVYLVFAAHTMNEDAADALLKDLEEPPDYAVIVLLADDLGPLASTIRSRCQHVPFKRLSQRAVKAYLSTRGASGEKLDALARLAGGRLDRADR